MSALNGLDSSAALLALQAQRQPQAIALRVKQRGLWRERSWLSLAQEVEQLAAALAGLGVAAHTAVGLYGEYSMRLVYAALAAVRLGAEVVYVERGRAREQVRALLRQPSIKAILIEDKPELELLLEPLELTGSARSGLTLAAACERAAIDSLGVRRYQDWLAAGADAQARDAGREHELPRQLADRPQLQGAPLLVLDSVLGPAMREHALAAWLHSGAVLHLPEPHGSALRDVREVSPRALFATPARYAALRDAALARYPTVGSWRRRWIERALRQDATASRLDRWLIKQPLRRQLGLSELAEAWVAGAPLDAECAGWLRGLGVTLRSGRAPESEHFRSPASTLEALSSVQDAQGQSA